MIIETIGGLGAIQETVSQAILVAGRLFRRD